MDPRTFAWNWLLVWPIEGALRFLAADLHLGAAIAIVLFTLALRGALLPFALGQARTRHRTQALRAPLEALKKRHAKDPVKLREATAALYKQHGVNPAGGALVLLLQLPLLFALYAALRDLGAHDASFQAPWLWLHGLNDPDTLVLAGQALPGPLPVVAAAVQLLQQRVSAAPATEGSAPPLTAAIAPIMTLWIGLSVSAGLVLYWIAQGAVGVAQGVVLRRALEGPPAAAPPPRSREAGRRAGS
jgi:YidC/Oxa1 family membrane protein insertase